MKDAISASVACQAPVSQTEMDFAAAAEDEAIRRARVLDAIGREKTTLLNLCKILDADIYQAGLLFWAWDNGAKSRDVSFDTAEIRRIGMFQVPGGWGIDHPPELGLLVEQGYS